MDALKNLPLFLLILPIYINGESKIPRIISLVPSITEIIYAIDGEDALVGIVDPEGYPTDIDKTIVGRFSSPNFERIYSLSPDIVFIEGVEQERFRRPIESLGVKVITIQPEDIEGIFAAISGIGNIIGKGEKASILIDSLWKELEEIRRLVDTKIERKTAFIELSQNPLVTVGRKSFLNSLLEEAGVTNIMSDIEYAYPVISQELVISRNPDVIIMAHKEGTDPLERIGWSNIEAVKDGNIIRDIDLNLLLRPGPRVIDGIKMLITAIYGEH